MNFAAFPRYEKFSPKRPVCCVTPKHPGAIHRFFDTSPISPDNKHLIACVLPYENKLPQIGDTADILLVDLENGDEKVIASTKGWALQVGAHAQWIDSHTVCYNDVNTQTWQPYLVKHDIITGEKTNMGFGVCVVSPNGRKALTNNLTKNRFTQNGYGVMIPDEMLKRNNNHPEDDGFFITDLVTGEASLFMPLSRLIDEAIEHPDEFEKGAFYGCVPKWSPDGKRIMYIVRWVSDEGLPRRNMLFTSDSDGGNIKLALHYKEWAKWGHHVNWHPDSEHITLNLRHNSDHIKFVIFRYDGGDLRPIMDDIYGSGHPTVYRDGRHILTDAYYSLDENVYPDGTVPIRWVDTQLHTDTELVRIMTRTALEGNFRLDPHPAWSYDWNYVAFNGYDENQRRVYVMDMTTQA